MGAISVQATIQGILAAGVATLGHQLFKQTFQKREGDQ
ncbi:phage holin family protein [Lactobacillus crispatus]